MKGADRAPDDVPFETGMPFHEGDFGHGWQPDPFITDDQALVLHLHNAGSSCSPTAAMLGSKIVRHAQRLTNIERVHAVCGGPPERPPRHANVLPTVDALAELPPDVVVLAHFTGWEAAHAIATRMPDAFIQNSVGARYELGVFA